VNWFRTIGVLTLLALWVPASSHALLQHAGLIHQDIEHHHDDGEAHDHGPADVKDHDAADGICRVESHSAKAPCPHFAIIFLVFDCVADLASYALVEQPEHTGPSPPGTAPPRPSGPRAPPLV
jgi:hypothetical protein